MNSVYFPLVIVLIAVLFCLGCFIRSAIKKNDDRYSADRLAVREKAARTAFWLLMFLELFEAVFLNADTTISSLTGIKSPFSKGVFLVLAGAIALLVYEGILIFKDAFILEGKQKLLFPVITAVLGIAFLVCAFIVLSTNHGFINNKISFINITLFIGIFFIILDAMYLLKTFVFKK